MTNSALQTRFERLAPQYRSLRFTDSAPLHSIVRRFDRAAAIEIGDVGCGVARYTASLLRELPNARAVCIDPNPDMLRAAQANLTGIGEDRWRLCEGSFRRLVHHESGFDIVTAFNSIHWFDNLRSFLQATATSLRAKGHLFMYTRLPLQNARTIWGRYFPEFAERETRLYSLEALDAAVAQVPELVLDQFELFQYNRTVAIPELVGRAREHHLSTFSMYSDVEFETAVRVFEAELHSEFSDGVARWVDENLMVVCRMA